MPAIAQQDINLPRLKNDTSVPRTYAFSVQQAIEYARKNNVQVRNALLDIRMQEEQNREITSNAFPKLNGSLSTTYNPNIATQVIPNFISPATYQVLIDEGVKNGTGGPIVMPGDFGFIPAQFGTKYSTTVGASLSQLLFDGQVFVGLQARRTSIDFRRASADVVDETIRTNIYKVYYQLVVGKTSIELLDANIDRLTKLLKDTRAIYDNGFAERLDVDKVNVQLTNLQTEKNRALNNLSNGYYGLKVLIGMPVKDQLILTDSVTDEMIKDGMLDNMEYAHEDRFDYKYAQFGKKLNEFNIRRYKLSLLPSVSVSGNYAKNAQRNKWDFFGDGDWFTISAISANIQVPIFNGFYTRAKINQAKIDLEKTNNQIEALKLTIDNEVVNARNNFNTALSSLDFQKRNLALADTVYQQTKKKYEVGTGSQTEINAAQADLKAAQTNYITTLLDAIIARVDYLKAVGKL
ncbi:MAG: TolC family protein [Chitinophagaceae bacterium]|nr:TolC family protein [Chitinophagaceae bacterium]